MKKKFQGLLFFLLFTILVSFPLSASIPSNKRTNTANPSRKPFVSCWVAGQLGNEICQIATTLAYAWDYNVDPFFPDLNEKEWNRSYNRDRFFFRLLHCCISPPEAPKQTFNEKCGFRYAPIPFKADQYLFGIFFCWKHFHHRRQELIKVFAPSDEVENYLQKKYADLIASPKTVSVHLRTYNQKHHETSSPFVGLDYYEKAMNLFPEDTIFVVFSDRIKWCKHHFGRFKKNIVFAEGNDHIEDFFLMSKMKSHILGNSSFSWWAAYLNTHPEKKVVAPRYWWRLPNGYVPCEKDKHNIFFPDWILLESDLAAPYPPDMKQYDPVSQSTDTQ